MINSNIFEELAENQKFIIEELQPNEKFLFQPLESYSEEEIAKAVKIVVEYHEDI